MELMSLCWYTMWLILTNRICVDVSMPNLFLKAFWDSLLRIVCAASTERPSLGLYSSYFAIFHERPMIRITKFR